MEQQHTQEPWRVSDDENGECIVFGKTTVAACEGIEFIDCNTSANARRIVACVNACAGISNDVLEQYAALMPAVEHCKELEKQRDELLAALIKAREDINWMINSQQFLNSFVFEYIDSAIASVKGGE